MHDLQLITAGPRQTEEFGKKIGRILRGGEVICLSGELGAGKTLFVRGVAKGLELKDLVKSPTFTLINEYNAGLISLFHFDLYRIKSSQELIEIGIEEYLYSNAVSIIEWTERAGDLLPSAFLEIKFLWVSQRKRKLLLTAHGDIYQKILCKL